MKREFDVFKTFQARGFDIYNHKEKFGCNVKFYETDKAIYYAADRDAEEAKKWLEKRIKREG